MELRDFVKKSLTDITLGVNDAKKEVYDTLNNQPIAPARIGSKLVKVDPEKIDFDIMISVQDSKSSKKGLGGKISVVNGGFGSSLNKSKHESNRIQFSIPYHPQFMENKDKIEGRGKQR